MYVFAVFLCLVIKNLTYVQVIKGVQRFVQNLLKITKASNSINKTSLFGDKWSGLNSSKPSSSSWHIFPGVFHPEFCCLFPFRNRRPGTATDAGDKPQPAKETATSAVSLCQLASTVRGLKPSGQPPTTALSADSAGRDLSMWQSPCDIAARSGPELFAVWYFKYCEDWIQIIKVW